MFQSSPHPLHPPYCFSLWSAYAPSITELQAELLLSRVRSAAVSLCLAGAPVPLLRSRAHSITRRSCARVGASTVHPLMFLSLLFFCFFVQRPAPLLACASPSLLSPPLLTVLLVSLLRILLPSRPWCHLVPPSLHLLPPLHGGRRRRDELSPCISDQRKDSSTVDGGEEGVGACLTRWPLATDPNVKERRA